MRRALLGLVRVFVALAPTVEAAPPPSNQARVYFNARLAQRDQQSTDVLRLWLLRNSLVDQGERGYADGDFQSIVWAALGDLGLCPDGFPHDDQGVGLWPLAVHNWVLQDTAQGSPPQAPEPFQVLEVGQQARLVSLHDVLAAEELGTVSFFRTSCLVPYLSKLEAGLTPWLPLDDQVNQGRVLRDLLRRSLTTLQRQQLEGVAVVEARIFDLDLTLAALQTQRFREFQLFSIEAIGRLGIDVVDAVVAQAETVEAQSEEGRILADSLTWPANEWLRLSPARRLFLFLRAREQVKDPSTLLPLELSILDALTEQGDGSEVSAWIGLIGAEKSPERTSAVFQGARGARLLALDERSGFRGRAAIALHRGVAFLEDGELSEALRSFAFAMSSAQEEGDSPETSALARRWLSFVLSRYQTTDEVIATLKALVPRQEYNAVIEDLAWRAALRADDVSFERVVRSARHGGAFDLLTGRLHQLAIGKPAELATELRDAAVNEPYFTLRFVKQLVERLEAEDADVRKANAPLLKLLASGLADLAVQNSRGSNARAVEELFGRLNAILEGLSVLDASMEGRARALSPDHSAFAGNVRVAPSDPLPWPFGVPNPESPSAFVPLKLAPVEWRDEQGALVFGWRVSE